MRWLAIAVLAIVVGLTALAAVPFSPESAQRETTGQAMSSNTTSPTHLSATQDAILSATQWLNTRPLTAADLKGKIVIVNVWTFTCINSLRPLPYLHAWAEKYKDSGLVIVGVHAPEFEVEKDVVNVRRAVAEQGVNYPVAIDSDLQIWKALKNRGWPAFYFFDGNGRIRHQHYGEGGYDISERLLQRLLREAGAKSVPEDLVVAHGAGVQAPPDWDDMMSDETYVGYAKARHFASASWTHEDKASQYDMRQPLTLNQWDLTGNWTIGSEFATLNQPSGRISFRFHARDLHLVMSPDAQNRPVRFRVTIDGKPPGADRGFDTDADGNGTVNEPRLYQLVRQAKPITDKTLEIEFLDPGLRAYVFTFG